MRSEGLVFFRPRMTPFARAFFSPFFTRSTISSRSNCEIAAITVKNARPIGELVSILSVIEMKSTLYFFFSSSAVSRWVVDLANRLKL